jgi:hypothetical protein
MIAAVWEDHDFLVEIFVGQTHGLAESFHQRGMRRLFNEQLDELIVRRRVAGIFHHTKCETFVDRVIGQIVLHGKAGEALLGKLARAQLAEIPAVH